MPGQGSQTGGVRTVGETCVRARATTKPADVPTGLLCAAGYDGVWRPARRTVVLRLSAFEHAEQQGGDDTRAAADAWHTAGNSPRTNQVVALRPREPELLDAPFPLPVPASVAWMFVGLYGAPSSSSVCPCIPSGASRPVIRRVALSNRRSAPRPSDRPGRPRQQIAGVLRPQRIIVDRGDQQLALALAHTGHTRDVRLRPHQGLGGRRPDARLGRGARRGRGYRSRRRTAARSTGGPDAAHGGAADGLTELPGSGARLTCTSRLRRVNTAAPCAGPGLWTPFLLVAAGSCFTVGMLHTAAPKPPSDVQVCISVWPLTPRN